jgi:PST family polysaccharide transporter
MAVVWGACGWRPGRPVRDSGVRAMLGFGGNFTGFSVVNYFARNLDNMLIGRFWGSQALGFYAKAYQLLLLPLDQVSYPLTTVAVPALSRLNSEPERYRRAYLRILEKIALVTMPGIALMAVTADWVVAIVLGPKWAEAARIFKLLGLAGVVQPAANSIGWLFITQGRMRQMFKWSFVGTSITVASFIVGLPWGAVGVAAAYAVTNVFVTIPLLLSYVGREGPVRAGDFYRAVAPPAFAAACTAAALSAFRAWGGVGQPFVGLVIASPLALLTTLASLYALPAGRRALGDFRNVYDLLRKKGEVA